MKEIPVNEDRFAAPDGSATDQATAAPSLSGAQLEPLREYVRVVARKVLTEAQYAVVEKVLGGSNQQEAAAELGWHKTKVTRMLHGASRKSRSKHVSAVDKLSKALRDDKAFEALFRRAVTEAEEQASQPPPDAFITDWWKATTVPARPDLITPLAVLMVAALLADKGKRQVRLDTLQQHMPSSAVSFSLPVLSSLGFWRFDGVYITIIRTPQPVPEPTSASVDPFLLTIFEALATVRSAAA